MEPLDDRKIKISSLLAVQPSPTSTQDTNYTLVVGKDEFRMSAYEIVLQKSTVLASYIQQFKPNTILHLPSEAPNEILFVTRYLRNPAQFTGLVVKPFGPDTISAKDHYGDVPFTSPELQYIWAWKHGIRELWDRVLLLYLHAFRSPQSTPDKGWKVLATLKTHGLEESPLGNLLLHWKAWQMRYVGPVYMAAYQEYLPQDSDLMSKLLTAVVAVPMKQCPGGDSRLCRWHKHGEQGEPDHEVLSDLGPHEAEQFWRTYLSKVLFPAKP